MTSLSAVLSGTRTVVTSSLTPGWVSWAMIAVSVSTGVSMISLFS